MIVRAGKKKFSVWAFDVESHNDPISIEKRETSIWLASFINEESKIEDNPFFYTIEDWLSHLREMALGKRKGPRESRPVKNILIFVFNLSFEFSFEFSSRPQLVPFWK